jgi:septation ring formation regulator EzrA
MSNKEFKELLNHRAAVEQKRSAFKNCINDILQKAEELKTDIAAAEAAVVLALDNLIVGSCTQTNVDDVRDLLQKLKKDKFDAEALIDPYERNIAKCEEELQKIEWKIPGVERAFWSSVASDYEGKVREVIGDLLLKTLAAQQLAGIINQPLRNHFSEIFFNESTGYVNGLASEHLKPFRDQLIKDLL